MRIELTPDKSVSLAALTVATSLFLEANTAQAVDRWHVSGFTGVLADGPWHDFLDPIDLEFVDSYLLGGIIGWDRAIPNSRFRIGAEVQLVRHFGQQDHYEVNVPTVLRYEFPDSFVNSAAFGLGLSYATNRPEVEIDRSGDTQRTFFYWMGEAEFALSQPRDSVFFRLHHRSDGFGIFEVDSGSTGLVVGLRRAF